MENQTLTAPRFARRTLPPQEGRVPRALRHAAVLLHSILLLPAAAVAQPPARIVSMAPNATEILFALGAGDRMVGRSDYCDFPPEALALPSVGNLTAPNYERALELKPNLVIAIESYGRKQLDRFRELGLEVRSYYGDRSYSDLFRSIRQIGEWSGQTAQAEALVASMNRRLEAITWPAGLRRPRSLWVVWWNPLMTTGRNTFLHESLTRAGGINIASEVDQESFTLSAETLIENAPDIVVLPCGAGEPCEGIGQRFHERFAAQPGWSAVPAFQRKAYCAIDQNTAHRPGPRVVEAVAQLNACFIRLMREATAVQR